MDTRLSGIEHNTSVNTTTLSKMNDNLTSFNARVITAETEIVGVKNLGSLIIYNPTLDLHCMSNICSSMFTFAFSIFFISSCINSFSLSASTLDVLSKMNDNLTSFNARVITAETEIVGVKNRVAELETSSQGTSNLFDEVKPKTEKLESDLTVIQTSNVEAEREKLLIQDEIKKMEKAKVNIDEQILDMQCRSSD
jgi:predicted  nucleic acid-binding Zn-ribbon protein